MKRIKISTMVVVFLLITAVAKGWGYPWKELVIISSLADLALIIAKLIKE